MQLGPILRSMRHHKGAFSLLVLEVAFGFVILSHTLVAARNYFRLHVRDTGMPDGEMVVARRRFLHPHDVARAREQERADLSALARIDATAAAVDGAPLPDAAAFPWLLRAAGGDRTRLSWPIRATPQIAAALGLQVLAGRSLEGTSTGADGATPVLITRVVAESLFGGNDAAVGRILEGGSWGRGRVTGVVEDFCYQGSWLPHPTSTVIVAAEPVSEHGIVYVLRGVPGRRTAVVEEAHRALAAAALPDADADVTVEPLERETTRYMRLSEGATIILLWTGFLVVAVAVAGSLAMASFSVTERTRQIGVRRALGARRSEIVRYFLLENAILTALGLALGLALALALNQILRQLITEMVMTTDAVVVSMAIFLGTGLLSALVPARRAAAIPPWAATRTL